MKICIIGGGWIGCHLTKVLRDKHQVNLFESRDLFSEISLQNQNRLHLGYHYCRSSHTRELCKNTFNRFLIDYNFLTDNIRDNLYAIPFNESFLDYNSYIKIFENFSTHRRKEINFLKNIEGVINTDEKFINPIKAKKYFSDLLSDNLIIKKITLDNIRELKENYDLVINCTNNSLDPIDDENIYSEMCHTLLYKKKKDIPFDALTLVDGKLFSIDRDEYSNLFNSPNWNFIKSNDDDFDYLKNKLPEKFDIIYLDTTHEADHVEKIFYSYFKKLKLHGFFL